jgi:hypothetical protein
MKRVLPIPTVAANQTVSKHNAGRKIGAWRNENINGFRIITGTCSTRFAVFYLVQTELRIPWHGDSSLEADP